MNPEIKAEWVADLRSGEYKQATGALREGDGYCCLGVLVDIWAKKNDCDWEPDPAKFSCRYSIKPDGELLPIEDVLPDVIAKWAGLDCDDPRVRTSVRGEVAISYINDVMGYTFNQIADLIEEQF